MSAQLGLDGLTTPDPPPPTAPEPAPAAARAVEEFLSGFAAQFAYGPRRTAAQERQAAQVGAELASRLAAFRASGAV